MSSKSVSTKDKIFGFLLMFIIGFVGFTVFGAIFLIILITLGLLPLI